MKLVLDRHYPVYPVIDADKRLIGLVRGQSMFEAHAIEISLQAGSMVGLEKEERVATPPAKSLKMRHPWLQLNLLTAFLAAAVVGACIASGISGAMVPLTLKRMGFDPATASSIFLTTATDVVSMGMLLFLATVMVR